MPIVNLLIQTVKFILQPLNFHIASAKFLRTMIQFLLCQAQIFQPQNLCSFWKCIARKKLDTRFLENLQILGAHHKFDQDRATSTYVEQRLSIIEKWGFSSLFLAEVWPFFFKTFHWRDRVLMHTSQQLHIYYRPRF